MSHRITELCDGCSACHVQCPTQAISGVQGTRFAIDPRACIDCGVCGQVCALAAVLDGAGRVVARVPRDERRRPVVDPNLCNGCGLCIDFCPFDCLRRVGPRYNGVVCLGDLLMCVSCGECERHCIKNAIVLADVDQRAFDPESEAAYLKEMLRAL